jgi:eukaryotic-like serine/threonine-protein kinase
MVAPPQAVTAEASIEPAFPQVCDRYRSLFVIGEGGMGRVEVALERGEAGFERVVALKRLLRRGPRDPRHVEMFLREARIAALLTHPNVVHAFSSGEAEGELFLAMQYVAGEPLSRVLAAGKAEGRGLEPVLVAWVLAEACEGLHAAHELRDATGAMLRVVHRDVSPHNVMIAYDGNVKVVDFGVARFDSARSATRTGEVKGKLAYMSPEQALGEELDRRSDLFSVGVVLFECLTGQRMWGEGTELQLMRRIALERPPRLDAVVPGAPAALVDLQSRMVARDPADRPATAKDVAAQLRAFALSAGGPGSRRVVAATMTALFREDARRRRDRLAAALQEVAPSTAAALREDLEPSQSAPPAAAPRRRGWLVLVAVAIAVGLGATLLGSLPPAPAAAPPGVASPEPRGPASPEPRGVESAEPPRALPPAPAVPLPGTEPAGFTASPGFDAPAANKTRPPRPATSVARPASAAKPATLGKLPHVDPSPF